MSDPVEALICDLLEWVGSGRPYGEVMEAWRTSCPRLPVWEEANRRGFLASRRDAQGIEQVIVTPQGMERLRERAALAAH